MIGSIRTYLIPGALSLSMGLSAMAGESQKTEVKSPKDSAVNSAKESEQNTQEPELKSVPAVVPIKLSKHESELHNMVSAAFGKSDAAGSRAYFNGRSLTSLSLRKSVMRALENNLSIQRQGKFDEISKSALEEAKAIFDPIFTASASYNRFEKFNRKETARRFRTATEPFDLNGNGVIDPNEENVLLLDKAAQDQSAIFALVFRDPRPAGFKKDTQQASRESAEGPEESTLFVFNVAQQLPWGNQVSIGVTTQRKETYYLKGFRIISPGTREYGRPWTSGISINLLVPAPFMKDFGRDSGAETQVNIAEFSKERAYWDTHTVINSTLLLVDLAYWDVVGTLESLRAATDNRKLLEGQLKAVEGRLKAGRATDYSLQQTKARVASVMSLEESAWNNYQRASNTLVNILDLKETDVIFPADYSSFKAETLGTNEDEIIAIGLSTRPELQAEKVSEKISQVLLNFAENQKRPNLKLNFAYSFTQVGSQLFGYRRLEETITNLANPDTIEHTYSATYVRPWGNRGLKSAQKQARYALNQQRITIADTQNLIEQQLSDALVQYLSSQKQLSIAKTSFTKAKAAFSQAQTLYENNRLTDFELIFKSSDLLNSDLDFVAAAVGYKKAEANLLAAQGIIASHYAERSTTSALLDQIRIKKIAQNRALTFFPPTKADAVELPVAVKKTPNATN